jgi:uncharacterized membrane protein
MPIHEKRTAAHGTDVWMNTAQGSILVRAPVGAVYRQWLRLEDSPQFLTAVKEVERLDANHFFMAAICNGEAMEAVLEIILRVPERRLAWRLVAGKSRSDHLASGVASFTSQSDRSTRVTLKVTYSIVGEDLSDRIQEYLCNFKRVVEDQPRRTRGTRRRIGTHRENR